MGGSRIWLSILALSAGFMAVWLLVSLRLLLIDSFGRLSLMGMLPYAVAVLIPLLLWLHLFFRERGSAVVISSRFGLSVCAAVLGGTSTYFMIFTGLIEPLELQKLSAATSSFVFVGTILPIVLWFMIFLGERRKAKAARSGRS